MTDKTYLLKADEDWDWRDLRNFVENSYKKHETAYIPSPEREAAIFKAFMKRWPDGKAVKIARYACKDGVWWGRPVTPLNFRKDFDSEFAEPIDKLMER